MNLELDDMKTAWQELDRRIEQHYALNLTIYRGGKLQDIRRALRPLRWGQQAQVVGGAALILPFARFWVAHLGALHLMLPGLMMHVFGLMLIASAARTAILIDRIDYSAPVLQIQQCLAELRLWRARVEQPVFAVVGCFIWIPLTLVVFAALGADIWVHAQGVVWSFIASGFACLGILYAIVRVKGRSAVENNFVGRGIRTAQSELDEIARFERE